MALTGFAIPHVDRGDSRPTSDSPLNLEGDASQWMGDNEPLFTEEAASRSGTEATDPTSSDTNEDFDLDEEIRSEAGFEGIVGQSSSLRRVLRLVETVAAGDSTVILLGETGTGKELIARAIHKSSRRNERNFVKLNCSWPAGTSR